MNSSKNTNPAYEVWIENACQRDLKRLQENDFSRIVGAFQNLSENPRPQGVRKIAGSESDWRLRVGVFRIIYEIDDEARAIRILRVRHRKEVYR
jgi:mRNA interferase RelE/StbE